MPFQASNTVFLPCETDLAWWNGDWVWLVSLVAYLLSDWKAIVLSFPFLLAQMTVLKPQVTDSPAGTDSMTHRRMSLSRPSLTSSCQCMGTGIGE